jgi:pimeloyl-ACP methyl ester carboxylesterase
MARPRRIAGSAQEATGQLTSESPSVETIRFYSHGDALAGTLKLPARRSCITRVPAVVQGPGWLGLREAKVYQPYHDVLLAEGIAVLVFDYRGFGDSEGDATHLDPMGQVEDYRSAASYLETRDDIDSDRLGAFGSGGTGGGNAIVAAGLDGRFKAMVSQVPISDGRDWLRRMRSEHEWLDFLDRVRQDRALRAATGRGEMVGPREDITIPTPERRTTTIKEDVDHKAPTTVALASAEAIMAYRPIDYVGRISPRASMIICVENDATTPEDHSFALYEAAGPPKRLVVQTGTTHYGAYAQYRDIVAPMIGGWFRRYLTSGEIRVREDAPLRDISYLSRQ